MQSVKDSRGAKQALEIAFSEMDEPEILPLGAQPSTMLSLSLLLRLGHYHVVIANPPYLGIKELGILGR